VKLAASLQRCDQRSPLRPRRRSSLLLVFSNLREFQCVVGRAPPTASCALNAYGTYTWNMGNALHVQYALIPT
jgi:hypothetical protein